MNASAVRILAGLVLGLAAGVVVGRLAAAEAILAVAGSVGKLWLDALTMTVVPLVFSLLVTGIAGAADAAHGQGVTRRALGWFAVLLVGSCLASGAYTALLMEAWPLPEAAAGLRASTAPPLPPLGSAADWFAGFIPANPIKAASETAMVPLVVFALFFGFAVTRIAEGSRAALVGFFRAIAETMLVIVGWVLLAAPLGVFALALGIGARAGVGAAGVLAQYIVVVAGSCVMITVLAYLAAWLLGRLAPLRFARAAFPAQVVALSTQSSLASLPAMIEAAARLDVPRASAGIVLPLAVAIFRAASAAANVAVAVYLAQVHGVALGAGAIVVGSLVGAAVSLGAVGLPAQVSFFATIGPVCLALGVPVELLPLLLAVETIPDLFRTVGNVTADLAVTRIASPADDDGGD
ncbi:MAG: cation:dicarboxylase symporter family transporter [Rhizorhabdus sp.]